MQVAVGALVCDCRPVYCRLYCTMYLRRCWHLLYTVAAAGFDGVVLQDDDANECSLCVPRKPIGCSTVAISRHNTLRHTLGLKVGMPGLACSCRDASALAG
jgi:hypothetical protein